MQLIKVVTVFLALTLAWHIALFATTVSTPAIYVAALIDLFSLALIASATRPAVRDAHH